MVKPIFVVGLPINIHHDDFEKVKENLVSKLKGYYVLVYVSYGHTTEFKCFFEKDFNEVKFEELKQIVSDSVK